MNNRLTEAYISILKEELLMATGCTEPIAIAYCAAKMRDILGGEPERIEAEVSGNILKNVKSVIVPNTGGLKGINAAIAAGIIAGRAEKVLQVISYVTQEEHSRIREYMEVTPLAVSCSDNGRMLDIRLTGYRGGDSAMVHIANNHSNIIREERNVELVKPLLDNQIRCNSAIAEEGLRGDWGANVGRVLLSEFGSDIKNEARAYAAAASDARMSGCELPVVIVTGSGNQGITASVPVIRYAKHIGASDERLYRALLVSDLVTIHQKTGIGRLSAYCGAVSAGCGAGAGIAYLLGGDYRAIAHTIVNAVAILSGTICDGAKPSCAAKIASAVEAGILGYYMYVNDQQFRGGDGIVAKGVENTIRNVGLLASQGMKQTDRVILNIMTGDQCL